MNKEQNYEITKKALDKFYISRKKVSDVIEKVFSEGWFNYFNTTYGSDDTNYNEKMIGDVEKKLKELKKELEIK